MSTPAQYIPPEFQQQLDLPSGGTDPGAVTAANYALTQANAKERALYNKVENLKTLIAKNAAAQGKTKDAKAIARLKAQEVVLRNDLASARTNRETAITGVSTAQNKVYEVTGQYDKLLTGANRDAFAALKSLFDGYGLGSLAGKIFDYTKQGYGADTISLLLQDTKEYKTRFAGNEIRTKNGLPVLSPGEYLATEKAYRDVLSAAGLPKGFYDSPTDFTNWIAGDVSPTEIKDRVDVATAWTAQASSSIKAALKGMYGVDESYLTAYALDRTRALPLLQKQARAAEIGAAAISRGFDLYRQDFEDYAAMGITGDQAQQGFAQIADSYQTMKDIAARFGLSWDQREAEAEVFTPGAAGSLGQQSAAEKGKGLRSQERAMFAGQQGSSSQGLNATYRQT